MHGSNVVRCEQDPVIIGRVYIMEHMKHGLHMARQRIVPVRGEKGMNSSEIRTCRTQQPTNATNKALIGIQIDRFGKVSLSC